MPTSASGTTNDKQNKSFVDSPTRGSDWTAREVFVGNGSADSIPVNFSTPGVVKYSYSEVSSTGVGFTDVLNMTVSAGLRFKLGSIDYSGDNRSVFYVEINSVTEIKRRLYFTKYNGRIELNQLELNEGDNIKVIVENKTNTSANFNATLIYNEIVL